MTIKYPWVFDHDGTLVDSFAAIVQASNEALHCFQFGAITAHDIRQNMVHATIPRFAAHAGLETQDPRCHQMAQFFYARCHEVAPTISKVYDGWQPLLERLLQLGHPLAVLSNNEGRLIRRILSAQNSIHPFSLILGEEDVPRVKPNPDGLLAIARFYDVPVSHLTMVGDSASDLGAAKQAGCRAIAVCWGAHPRQELEQMDWDHFVDSPSELMTLIG